MTRRASLAARTAQERRMGSIRPENAIRDTEGIVIGSWNGKSINSLQKVIFGDMFDFECMPSPSGIPHQQQIPGDLKAITAKYDCGFDIWGCDGHGYCLVDFRCYDNYKILHAVEVRIHLVKDFGFCLADYFQ